MAKKPNKVGRPSKYTPELVDKICKALATSERGLNAICKEPGMPTVTTVFAWLADPKKQEFTEKYRRAREAQMDFMAETILDISDDGSDDTIKIEIRDKKGKVVSEKEIEDKEWTSRSKLRVEARKWLMSKLHPKKYGDKIDVTSGDEPLKNFAPQIIIQQSD